MGMTKYNNQKNIAGSIIKQLREQKCMEMKDMCREYELRGIEIDRFKLYKIENNKISIKDFELVAFAKVLNVTVEELLQDFISEFEQEIIS